MAEENKPGIVIMKNGPYMVSGSVPLAEQTIVSDADGGSSEWMQGERFEEKENYALCRCGQSVHAPFCDGTHVTVRFDGTETASQEPFDAQKTTFEGPEMVLDDARAFCAVARFCDTQRSAWDSLPESDDPKTREHLMHQVSRCPSGRLVLRDRATGAALEPELPLSIGVVEDPAEKCSGPLWVRGGIPVWSELGEPYEVRNRVTLCRCGQSKNKPFCDGSHVKVHYQDGRKQPQTPD